MTGRLSEQATGALSILPVENARPSEAAYKLLENPVDQQAEPLQRTGVPPPSLMSSKARIYAVGLLLLIYVFNFVDRQIVTILGEAIKADLHLADWQLGIVTGLSFAVFYSLLGIPIARLADRMDRAKIITISLVLWSTFTVLCGKSQSFVHLMLLRIGVGVGEAGCSPAAHSLITDYVPRHRRAFAMSVYAAGMPIGVLLGLALGGLVAQTWGWRVAFVAAGAPGIVLAALAFLTLRDPRSSAERTGAALGASFGEAMRLLKPKRSYWTLSLALGANGFVTASFQAFAAPFFIRNHSGELASFAHYWSEIFNVALEPIGFLGLALGLSYGLSGAAGMLMGGVFSDALGRRDERGYLVAPAIAAVLAVPACAGACLVSDTRVALCLWGVGAFMLQLPTGAMYAAVQTIAPRQARAMAAAVMLLSINLLGGGLGPLFTGSLSDLLNDSAGLGSGTGIRWALVSATLMAWGAAILFWTARRTIVADCSADRASQGIRPRSEPVASTRAEFRALSRHRPSGYGPSPIAPHRSPET